MMEPYLRTKFKLSIRCQAKKFEIEFKGLNKYFGRYRSYPLKRVGGDFYVDKFVSFSTKCP